ncbi:MAG: response regulator [Bacteroidetes bacterium]|nr:response regulator [Bacteroidota bacterium]MBU2508478.1 response regulator [Bacteroidota bacterium]
MVPSSKFDLLDNYNHLIKLALQGKENFPDEVCNFLVSDFEFQSAVLFKIVESKSLLVLGRSSNARKNYLRGSEFTCSVCKLFKNPNYFSIHTDSSCELQISEFVIYESCISFDLDGSERAFLKIAKKNPFSQNDTESLKKISEYIKYILVNWSNARGGNTNLSEKPFGSLVVEIANELRSGANSIIGSSSILAEDNLTSSQHDYISSIKKNAQSLLINLKDFIDISKLETSSADDNKKNVNLQSIIDDAINICKTKYPGGKQNYSVKVDSNLPPTLNIDDSRLRFILGNLLLVSTSLTEKGEISIKVNQLSADKVQFIISDSGRGLSESSQKYLFEAFGLSKIEELKKIGLSGLTLVLLKRYISLMHGELRIISNPGKGSSFNFSVNADLHEGSMSPIAVKLPKPTTQNNILVIEDDYATSKLLSNYLNKWGYNPTIVNTEDQTFSQLEKEKYLAIILDIELPNINGLELLKKIHEHKNAKNIPVIVCSVEAAQQKAFMMGAVEYFVKPINYNFLVEVLTSYKLRKNSNILCVDDDVPTLNLVKQAIETAGFNAIAENVSAKVMDLISDKQIDLAIVDLDMPAPNGFELIKLIKSNSKFTNLPIIIYTGKENYQEDLKKIDGLFEELLDKKSTNLEDLAGTISAMINRYEEPTPVEKVMGQSKTEEKKDVVKILFAEDYKHSQIIVTRLLKKNNFENVVVVENGEEALNMAKKDQFDLILMDMQMPIMNGFEATENIRKLPNYKDTTIIALTAFAMKGDKEKCLEAGATDYIPKPIDSKEFIEKVKYYTNASK